MLVLSRRIGEQITIFLPGAEPVRVMLVAIKGGSVRVGIDAEPEVKILRSELVAARPTCGKCRGRVTRRVRQATGNR